MSDYEKLKVTELKTLLKERGIAATGLTKKAQYVQALIDEDEKGTGGSDDVNGEESESSTAAKAEAATISVDNVDGDAQDLPDAPPVSADTTDKATAEESSAQTGEDAQTTTTAPATEAIKPEPAPEALPADEKESAVDDRKRKRGDVANERDDAGESTPKKIRADDAPVNTKPRSDESAPASRHTPSAALYIKNLMRPLQLSTFQEYLASLAGADAAQADDIQVHLDSMKTHAFAKFRSTAAASAVRDQLYDRVWPEESQRKALWVDFLPEDKLETWIDQERNASRDARFEIVYSEDADGNATASLSEIGARSQQRQNATPQVQGQGMPGAPQGPRGQRQQEYNAPRDEVPQDRGYAEPAKQPEQPQQQQQQGGSFSKLDQYFSFTTAKPKIYFKPVASELAERRLADLDHETSRDWQGGRAWNRSTRLAPIDQLRRYTFEDGDKVVDGGVDFGGFGKRQFAGGTGPFIPGGPPRGRGGRGGGGYRGGY